EDPAELHGYGPISAETARRLARQAARWTPVERDRHTEEILRVGRRRKVPPGLQRWLRARDGTCRFPGCRTNALISEIDHTTPWSRGGTTDHDNLEHLCRRHHMFKTQGFWKARQHSPGIIEWVSPGGRVYRTEPPLHLASGSGADSASPFTGTPGAVMGVPGAASGPPPSSPSPWGSPDDPNPSDYGDDPPPF
ncbi:HNH endonuclease, partial [Arthrobacter sp. NPDC097144]|uniref:HNH endonuclease n=1 Tax=Arthrobacter sp. NPDC097144 TaxID=3363946 RepID=UPI00382F3472